jgi:putative addiction module component (TIGR02574 family)
MNKAAKVSENRKKERWGMSAQSKRILNEALELPPVQRAALVEEILSSFDFPLREEVDSLWAKEAEDRIRAYDRGEIKTAPATKVFAKINRRKTP